MTQTTEQERADFEAAFIEQKLMERGISGDVAEKDLREVFLWKDAAGCYDHKETKAALWGWQSARRAQVVVTIDVDAKVQEVMRLVQYNLDHMTVKSFEDIADKVKEFLAAAPQPPEEEIQPTVCKTEIQTIGCNEAAPVQLPEPVGVLHVFTAKAENGEATMAVLRINDANAEKQPLGYHNVVTEQQVSQLLASTNKPE